MPAAPPMLLLEGRGAGTAAKAPPVRLLPRNIEEAQDVSRRPEHAKKHLVIGVVERPPTSSSAAAASSRDWQRVRLPRVRARPLRPFLKTFS